MNETQQTALQGRAMVDQGWAKLRDALRGCPPSWIEDVLAKLRDIHSDRNERDRRLIDNLATIAIHEALVRFFESPADEEGGLS